MSEDKTNVVEMNTEKTTNMDRVMQRAQTNPVIRKHLERVQRGEQDYGTALELTVIELADQVQSFVDNYRGRK